MRPIRLMLAASCILLFNLCTSNLAYAANLQQAHRHAAASNTCCSATPSHPLTTAPVTLELAAFSAIDATGPIELVLLGQQTKQSVTLVAPAELIQFANVAVRNHTLVIDAHPPLPQTKPVVIQIKMAQPLTSLILHGSAVALGQQLANPQLIITVNDSASVVLRGATPSLHGIQNDGIGQVVVAGLKTNNLLIGGSGTGKVVLSGETRELNAQMGGSLVLEAQHLQALQAHILTTENANSYVSVLGTLYAFAYNNSNIYYHQQPKEIVRNTHASGNVLQMPS